MSLCSLLAPCQARSTQILRRGWPRRRGREAPSESPCHHCIFNEGSMTPFLLVLEAVWRCSLTFQLLSWVRKKLLFCSASWAHHRLRLWPGAGAGAGASAWCRGKGHWAAQRGTLRPRCLGEGAPRSPCARCPEREDLGCSAPTWTCGSGAAAAWRPCPCGLIHPLVHFR